MTRLLNICSAAIVASLAFYTNAQENPCNGVECAEGMMCAVIMPEGNGTTGVNSTIVADCVEDLCFGVECGEGMGCMHVMDAAGNDIGIDCMPLEDDTMMDPCVDFQCPEFMMCEMVMQSNSTVGPECVPDMDSGDDDGMMDPCHDVECPEGMVCEMMMPGNSTDSAGPTCVPDMNSGDDGMVDPCHDMECPEGLMCEVKMGENGEMMAECVDGMIDPCDDMQCPEGMICEMMMMPGNSTDAAGPVCVPDLDSGDDDGMMDPCHDMECPEGLVCEMKMGENGEMMPECVDGMMDPCHDMECPEGMMCEVKMGENGEMMAECVDGMMDPCHDMECPEGMMCEVKMGENGEMMAECVPDMDSGDDDGICVCGTIGTSMYDPNECGAAMEKWCNDQDMEHPACGDVCASPSDECFMALFDVLEMVGCDGEGRPCAENGCMNGGECVVEWMSHGCVCKEGFWGEMCEEHDNIEPSCEDGMMNGAEEGVDCGGPDCKMCMGEHCAVDDDCAGEGMCVCEPKMDDAPKRLRKHKKSRRHINFYSGGDMDDCFCKKPEDDMMPPMN